MYFNITFKEAVLHAGYANWIFIMDSFVKKQFQNVAILQEHKSCCKRSRACSDLIQSFNLSNNFIMISVVVDLESIPGSLDMTQE